MKTKNRKANILFLCLAVCLIIQVQAWGNGMKAEGIESHPGVHPDPIKVTGTVKDQEGETLIGVNVQVKGTNKGTSTDFEGNFELDDIDGNAVLVFSYIGYQTLEVPVEGRSIIDITLASDVVLLEEVVVVGYGTQKKINLTGADDYLLTNGYFDPLKEQIPNGFGFRVDRDYLSPLSTVELVLNPQLEQNPGW